MTEIAQLGAWQQRRLLEVREIRVRDLIEACLARVERHNPRINAVVTLSETVLDEADRLDAAADRGEVLGPLHGLPVGVKDVTETRGLRTTYGCTVYADNVPNADALVVERLRRSGAIVLGKTNTPEFAAGGHTFNEVFGATCNPWDPSRSPGGSTGGGAAALVSGMISLAQGTDLGGSLRIPASFCGVVGLRPSAGLIPTWPSDYLWDDLQVTGGMGRLAEDVALFLQALAGPSSRCPIAQPAAGRDFLKAVETADGRGLRLAYCPDVAGIGVDPDVESVCRGAAFEMRQAGATVDEIELDLSFAQRAFLDFRGYWMLAHHRSRLEHLERFGANLAGNIRAGLEVTSDDLARAEADRGRVWETFRDLFERYDRILTPCMAVPPFPVQENYPRAIAGRPMKTYVDWIAPTFLLSLTSLPVGSVPCGLDPSGLPVGLQIVSRARDEEGVLALASLVQQARPIGQPPTLPV